MLCAKCGKDFENEKNICTHCGEVNTGEIEEISLEDMMEQSEDIKDVVVDDDIEEISLEDMMEQSEDIKDVVVDDEIEEISLEDIDNSKDDNAKYTLDGFEDEALASLFGEEYLETNEEHEETDNIDDDLDFDNEALASLLGEESVVEKKESINIEDLEDEFKTVRKTVAEDLTSMEVEEVKSSIEIEKIEETTEPSIEVEIEESSSPIEIEKVEVLEPSIEIEEETSSIEEIPTIEIEEETSKENLTLEQLLDQEEEENPINDLENIQPVEPKTELEKIMSEETNKEVNKDILEGSEEDIIKSLEKELNVTGDDFTEEDLITKDDYREVMDSAAKAKKVAKTKTSLSEKISSKMFKSKNKASVKIVYYSILIVFITITSLFLSIFIVSSKSDELLLNILSKYIYSESSMDQYKIKIINSVYYIRDKNVNFLKMYNLYQENELTKEEFLDYSKEHKKDVMEQGKIFTYEVYPEGDALLYICSNFAFYSANVSDNIEYYLKNGNVEYLEEAKNSYLKAEESLQKVVEGYEKIK